MRDLEGDDEFDDAGELVDGDEQWIGRVMRIAAPSRMLRRGEISGGLGDLGTFLPDVVALSIRGQLASAQSMVFFNGLWSCWAGILFDLPMPIQPMHAVVAVALTEGLQPPQLIAASIWLGGFFALLGGLGLVSWCEKVIPKSVVRGLQLGLGLKVFSTGVELARKTIRTTGVWHALLARNGGGGSWLALLSNHQDGVIELVLLAISIALAIGLYGNKTKPASLALFVLGLYRVATVRPQLALGLHTPFASLPTITAEDWWQGLYRAALPQLPVTLLNAVIATSRLADDLYPNRREGPVNVNTISLSIGLMNLSTGGLGHFPSCHGCGGLAGQHAFGARTGSSMVLMGLCKMLCAVLLGPSLMRVLEAFPNSVLGVLLGYSGLELAASCRDTRSHAEASVMLLGAGCVLKLGTGAAFVISALAAAVVLRGARE